MKTLLRLKLRTQLIIVMLSMLSLLGAAGLYTSRQHHDVSLQGPVYGQIILDKDLIADILPPPAFLLEAWQTALVMVALRGENIDDLLKRSERLDKEFVERHEHWAKTLRDPSIREAFELKVTRTGQEFLAFKNETLIPAVRSKDEKAIASAITMARVLYIQHRSGAEDLAKILADRAKQSEQDAIVRIERVSMATTIVSIALALVMMSILYVMVSAVIKRLGGEASEIRELARRMARGDFSAEVDFDHGDRVTALSALGEANQSLRDIEKQMSEVHARHSQGQLSARLDTGRLEGGFKAMAEGINRMAETNASMVTDLSSSLVALAEGRLDTELREMPGELAAVNQSIQTVRDSVRGLIQEVSDMSASHLRGDVDVRLRSDHFNGEFGQLADGINRMVGVHIDDTAKVVDFVTKLGNGDFASDMAEMPGQKAKIKQSLDKVRKSLHGLIESVTFVGAAHDKGEMDATLHADRFKGDFAMLAASVNRIIENSLQTNTKAMAVVRQFGEGHFDASLEQFPGKKAVINQVIEQVRGNLKALIDDVNLLSEAVKRGEVLKRAEAGRHPGDFSKVVQGINETLDLIVTPLVAVRLAADTINTGAREISQGNMDLSRRTETQAASLEETTQSMDLMAATVRQNADDAQQANRLATDATAIANKGGQVVGKVVETMRAINASARKIEDIIALIDAIAFQTNILALNAAVEAARAGEQGRGFAVVAGEVRNLAQRSAGAAKEIKDLIGEAVAKATEGTNLVESAGSTMNEVVASVESVSSIMSKIAEASAEQSAGIVQVNDAIKRMDEVTMQNAALVEQAAAASESMLGQAVALSEAVGVFRLDSAASDHASAATSAVKSVATSTVRAPVRSPGSAGAAASALNRSAAARLPAPRAEDQRRAARADSRIKSPPGSRANPQAVVRTAARPGVVTAPASGSAPGANTPTRMVPVETEGDWEEF